MRTTAILPMKPFGDAKRRLADGLGRRQRRELARAMLLDVLATLEQADGVDEIAVVTADPEVREVATVGGTTVVDDVAPDGQSAAAAAGVAEAIAGGSERVLLVPGDTPLVQPSAIDELLRRSAREGDELVIIPDRHRKGTNALLIAPPDRFEPSFGVGSLDRHQRAAEQDALRYRVVEIAGLDLDVDTPADLEELRGRLARSPDAALRTRATLLASAAGPLQSAGAAQL